MTKGSPLLRSAVGAAIAAVAAASLLGCGGSSSSTNSGGTASQASSSPSPPSTAGPTPDLKVEALMLSDLPTGWTTDVVSSGNNSNAPKCFENVKTSFHARTKNEVAFKQGTSLPSIEEDLGYFPNTAREAFTAGTSVLDGCGQISFTSSGHTFKGQVSAMSFPTLGDQSKAYQVALSTTASGLDVTAGVDVIAVRKASTIMLFFYEDLGNPDVATVQQLAQKCVSKLS